MYEQSEKGDAEQKLLRYAAAAESASSHPIALSICKAYKERYGAEPDERNIENIEEIAGHGIQATVMDGDNPVKILAGNLRLMDRFGVTVEDIHDEGTSCYIAVDGIYAGCIVISDVVKPNSRMAMESLADQGIKTVMLTGDSRRAAETVSEEVGVSAFKAELLPGDKVSEVELLLAELGGNEKNTDKARGRLAFVGDGINDAPVLARADIGIAMGAMGSDAAIEAADVVLMDDDPAKISLAMKISRKTLRIVRQNIVFAIAVKVLCLLLGAFGFANMWVAIFADVGVMVIAVINATRCLRIR